MENVNSQAWLSNDMLLYCFCFFFSFECIHMFKEPVSTTTKCLYTPSLLDIIGKIFECDFMLEFG